MSFQVPFQTGGAAHLARGLLNALRAEGHNADFVTMPFRFFPDGEVNRAIDVWQSEDLSSLNMMEPDLVIPLAFPSYCCKHPKKRPWLMHQFRGAYELFDRTNALGISEATRARIVSVDNDVLSGCERIFTISNTVAERLRSNNGVLAQSVYHPPPLADEYYAGEVMPFVFAPSRIESLKRLDLLVDAMALVKAPVGCLIAGMGGQYGALLNKINAMGLMSKVRLLGNISDDEKVSLYAHSLAVFFGPRDEDYGYVTLEAMLSSKPVITCNDSGGPLEFISDGDSGMVVEPTPQAVADAIDQLHGNPRLVASMGLCGRETYAGLHLSWERTVKSLLADV